MATPESLDGLVSAMSLTQFDIGSNFYGMTTHIVDPHDFYVVPIEYIDILASLSEPGDQCCLEQLEPHQTVIYQSQVLHHKVRGIIIDIKKEHLRIFAVDHGFYECEVSIKDIYQPLYEEASTTPSLTQHCELDMCFPRDTNFSQDSIDAFKYYMGDEKLKVYILGKKDGKLRVTVYNSCPEDIATLLALTSYTCFANFKSYTASSNDVEIRSVFSFQHPEVTVGQSIEARVQSGSELDSFYVMPVSSYKDYIDTRQEFHSYCQSASLITPEELVVGTAVGVESETNRYERGVILEIIETDDKAKIKLVDCGNDILAHISRVKSVKTRVFTNRPIFSLYCAAVHNFEPWDNGLPQFLFKGYNFRITIEEVGHGFERPHLVSITKL